MRAGTHHHIRFRKEDRVWLKRSLADHSGTHLPKDGFLAGGAVAALLCKRAWGGDYPVNDLDVFHNRLEVYSDFARTPFRAASLEMEPDAYRNCFNLRTQGYRVLSSTREGMFNHVDVEATSRHQFNRLILGGFDLNCCQAGFDLDTGTILMTKAFSTFLKTGQLLVTNLATPYHTTIRLARKQQEYGCYCDLKTEVSLLASAGDLLVKAHGDNRMNRHHAGGFGAKYRTMYQQYQKALKPVCSLAPVSGSRYELYKLDFNIGTVTDSLLALFNGKKDCLNSQSLAQAFDLLCRPHTPAITNNRFKESAEIGDVGFTNCLAQDGYLSCPMPSRQGVRRLEMFLKRHSRIKQLFDSYQMNQYEQVQACDLIQNKEKQHSWLFTGLMESSVEPLRRYADSIEQFIRMVERKYLEILPTGDLVHPVDLSGFYLKEMVCELTSCDRLILEGKVMHHCVGGYSPELRRHNGNYRIFHIDDGASCSTVALRNGRIVEHKGVCNADPTPGHQMVAQKLAAFIPWNLTQSPLSFLPDCVENGDNLLNEDPIF